MKKRIRDTQRAAAARIGEVTDDQKYSNVQKTEVKNAGPRQVLLAWAGTGARQPEA